MLKPAQLKRYSRHLLLPEVGMEGQEKLLNARVLIVGVGGLGCPIALYLTAAGVGNIGLVDFDVVDESNLQRQVLFTHDDVGKSKAEMAKLRLSALNPDVNFTVFNTRLTSANAEETFANYDYIVDGTDNFATRYLVNDACVLFKKVNVYGSIYRFEGQATVYAHPDGPCYRCVFPNPPEPGLVPNCAEAGVLGILPGQVGITQATETIKLILGRGRSLVGRLKVFDALDMDWSEMKIKKNPKCPVCGENPTVTELVDYDQFCGIEAKPEISEIVEKSSAEIKEILENESELLLLDVREIYEAEICKLDNSTLIPLGQINTRLDEIESYKDKTVIAYCHYGMRSRSALKTLQENGFSNLINLDGGIAAWAREIDSSMSTY